MSCSDFEATHARIREWCAANACVLICVSGANPVTRIDVYSRHGRPPAPDFLPGVEVVAHVPGVVRLAGTEGR